MYKIQILFVKTSRKIKINIYRTTFWNWKKVKFQRECFDSDDV